MASPLDTILHQPVDIQRERLLGLTAADLGRPEVAEFLAKRPDTMGWLMAKRPDLPAETLSRAGAALVARFSRSDTEADELAPVLAELAARGALDDASRTMLRADVERYMGMNSAQRDEDLSAFERAQAALTVLAGDPAGLRGLDVSAVFQVIGVPEEGLATAFANPELTASAWARLETAAIALPAEQDLPPIELPGVPPATHAMSDLELLRVIEETAGRQPQTARRMYGRVAPRLRASTDPEIRAALLASSFKHVRLDAITNLTPLGVRTLSDGGGDAVCGGVWEHRERGGSRGP